MCRVSEVDLPLNDEEMKIEVSDPKSVGGHTAYNLKGIDSQGEFEVVRRYKEFLAFRDMLKKRYPGFYVPPVPGKKAKKMDSKVIHERAYLLNRFMEKVAADKFIWDSEEVQVFTRPSSDVNKEMIMLPRLESENLYEKLKTSASVNDEDFSDG